MAGLTGAMMINQLQPVLAAMAGGTTEPLGWFEYDVPSRAWSWSATLFLMHGFEPGEIVPTTAIFVSHKHPQDRQHTDEVLAAVLQTGQPFCCRHRIITAQQQVRTVVTIGRGELDEAGRVCRVFGYFVDITDAGRRASEADIHDAVEKSAATRAVIEQAKGALMVVQGVSAEDAFAVLRWHSSHANLKLRDVAALITQGMSDPLTSEETPNQRISRLLAAVVPQFNAPRGVSPPSIAS
jgi:hypothetical protein